MDLKKYNRSLKDNLRNTYKHTPPNIETSNWEQNLLLQI